MRIASRIGFCLVILNLFSACSSVQKLEIIKPEPLAKEHSPGTAYKDYIFLRSQLQIYAGENQKVSENLDDYLKFLAKSDDKVEVSSLKVMRARVLLGLGDYSGAGKLYFDILSQHFEDKEALAEVARFFYTIQSYDQALALYEHLIKEDSKNENHLVYAGLISLELKKFSLSKKYFNKIIKKFPQSKHLGHYYLGELYETQKNFKSSLWHYDLCNKKAPVNFSACVLGQSKVLDLKGEYKNSIKVLSLYLKKSKNEAVLKKIINMHFMRLNYKEALAYMFELEKLKPYDLDVKRKLGSLLVKSKEYNEALTRFELVSNSREAVDEDHINVLKALKVSGKEGQIRDYVRSIAQTKNVGELFFKNTNVFFPNKKESSVCSIARKENKGSCFFVLGQDKFNLKEYKAAKKAFKNSLRYNDNSQKAFYMLGRTEIEDSKNFKSGEKNILKAIELDAVFSDALNYLAYTWALKGVKLEQSLSFSQRALSQEPTNGHFLDTFGYILYQMKEYENALDVFMRAARLVPNNPEIYEHIADAYAQLNNPSKALSFYELASALLKGENLKKLGGKIARYKKQNSRLISSSPNEENLDSNAKFEFLRVPASSQKK